MALLERGNFPRVGNFPRSRKEMASVRWFLSFLWAGLKFRTWLVEISGDGVGGGGCVMWHAAEDLIKCPCHTAGGVW